MSSRKKKSGLKSAAGKNFLVQGSILAIASILAKIIGMVYRIPLTNILGDSGNSYYSTANEIYSIILMVSSFSVPLALSKMMSERINRGEYRNANKVFRCAMRFSVVSGAVMAILTYLLAGIITRYVMNFELAKYGLRVIAPAILIFAITGTFRGYFQGFGNMVPTAVSQIIEQIVNAVLSVVCAALMFRYGEKLAAENGNSQLGPAWGAAGGTFGTVGSVTIALIFMMIVYQISRTNFRRQMASDPPRRLESSQRIYRELLETIIPIVLSTVVYNISTVMDQGIFNAVLKSQGYSEEQYSIIWGIYVGKYRVLMNVVLSLASSLGPAIVPSMTAAIASRDKKKAIRNISSAIRFTMIFCIPCAFGLAALGGPIISMLFHPTSGMPLSIGIMKAGAVMIILYSLSTLTTSILQGMDKMKEPLYHNVIALIIHVVCIVVFLRVLNLNIYAVIAANTVFALVVCVLNAHTIRVVLKGYRQEVYKTFFIPTVASIIMAFVSYGVYNLFHHFIGVTLPCILAILVGMFVYLYVLVAFHGIEVREIQTMPHGQAILRICRKLYILR